MQTNEPNFFKNKVSYKLLAYKSYIYIYIYIYTVASKTKGQNFKT